MKHEWFNSVDNFAFVSLPSKKEDLSIKKVDEFFATYDDEFDSVEILKSSPSDTTFNNIMLCKRKILFPTVYTKKEKENIIEKQNDNQTGNGSEKEETKKVKKISQQSTLPILKKPEMPTNVGKRKATTRLNAKLKTKAISQKKLTKETSHLPTIRKSFVQKSKR